MSDFNYATALTRCMIISALALLVGVAFPIVPPVASFFTALAPLIWYHTMFLRPRTAEGLSQAAIDSVYYYGFLITVGALGATALDLSLNGIEGDFAPVAFQFGLGLLATGYAVWARVHLLASTKILDEEELRELMSQQIAKSRELLSNIELVSASFETFSTTLLDKSEQFATRVEARAKDSIEAAMKAFELGITSLAEQAQTALNNLRTIVNDVTFGAERETLRNSVSAMVETVAALSAGLEELKTSTSAGSISVGEFAGSLERVNSSAAGAADKLGVLGQDKGVVAKFGESLIVGTENAQGFGLAANVAAVSVTALSDKASAAHEPIEGMTKKVAQAQSKLEKLEGVLDTAVRAVEQIGKTNDSLLELGAASEASGAELQSLQGKLAELRMTLENLNAALIDSTGGLKDSMSETSDALDGAYRRAVAAAEELSSRSVLALTDAANMTTPTSRDHAPSEV